MLKGDTGHIGDLRAWGGRLEDDYNWMIIYMYENVKEKIKDIPKIITSVTGWFCV